MHEPMMFKKKQIGGKSTTFDPLKKGSDVILSAGNRLATMAPTGQSVKGLVGQNSGKWYFELKAIQFEGNAQFNPLIGIGTDATGIVNPWFGPDVFVAYGNSIIYRNNLRQSYPFGYNSEGAIVGIAVDFDADYLRIAINGVFSAQFPLATYANATAIYYPLAGSPFGGGSRPSIVEFIEYPQFLPPGYSAW